MNTRQNKDEENGRKQRIAEMGDWKVQGREKEKGRKNKRKEKGKERRRFISKALCVFGFCSCLVSLNKHTGFQLQKSNAITFQGSETLLEQRC